MRKKLLILGFLVLLIAALSLTDAEIVRDLEFFESMDSLETDEWETIQSMAEDEETKLDEEADNKDESDAK